MQKLRQLRVCSAAVEYLSDKLSARGVVLCTWLAREPDTDTTFGVTSASSASSVSFSELQVVLLAPPIDSRSSCSVRFLHSSSSESSLNSEDVAYESNIYHSDLD